MDWVNRMAKFHGLRGTHMDKYPLVGNGFVNFYKLKSTVHAMGGYNQVCRNHEWGAICARLELATVADIESADKLEYLYRRFVVPYERYIDYVGHSVFGRDLATPRSSPKVPDTSVFETPPGGHIGQLPEQDKQDFEVDAKRRKRGAESLLSPPPERILRKRMEPLATVLTQPGSARARRSTAAVQSHHEPATSSSFSARRSSRLANHDHVDYNDDSDTENTTISQQLDDNLTSNTADLCGVCYAKVTETVLKCNDCEERFHDSCLDDDLSLRRTWPEENPSWYCPKCLVGNGEFYFDEGGRYTLPEFQEMAANFRDEYLDREFPIVDKEDKELVECLVESAFWKHMEDVDCRLAVEYGADIHCDVVGSGFPTVTSNPYNKYSRDPWNLNVLPHIRQSLFRHLKSEISGVTIPWAYVGMMFSAFCWHSEDHNTYSINYQHFGDSKTWYGIPPYAAGEFEALGRSLVPELFEKQPDILFQRATMISPAMLKHHGVPCYVADQRAGQFIITFPNAYHAGFNHGFNFNEAVNYAPPEWVPKGRLAYESYKQQHRSPLFSHDAILLWTALNDQRPETAEWLCDHLANILISEAKLRSSFLRRFPHCPQVCCSVDYNDEDLYACSVCNSLAYLSRLMVANPNGKPTCFCLDHAPMRLPRGAYLELRYSIEEIRSICLETQAYAKVKTE
jgi:histone demethylase JARID1